MPFKYQGNDIKKTLIILPHIALELFFYPIVAPPPLIIKTVSMLQEVHITPFLVYCLL